MEQFRPSFEIGFSKGLYNKTEHLRLSEVINSFDLSVFRGKVVFVSSPKALKPSLVTKIFSDGDVNRLRHCFKVADTDEEQTFFIIHMKPNGIDSFSLYKKRLIDN